mgnify:FL=1
MRRKSTEDFIKKSMDFSAPEEVWDKIKNQPIQNARSGKPERRPKTAWYAAAACIAACVVLVCVLAVNKSPKLPASDSLLNTENDTEQDAQIVTDKAGEPESVIGETIPQSAGGTTSSSSSGDSSMGVFVPVYKVWNHRLYKIAGDDTKLSDSDLGSLHREKINGTEIAVYSLKNIPMEQSIGDKKNGIVLRYDCILDGIFELRGKKYGIVSETAYICPVPEKGKYLGEVNGVKCYEFKGKADAILVDLGKYVSPSDGSIYESLYVAELIG